MFISSAHFTIYSENVFNLFPLDRKRLTKLKLRNKLCHNYTTPNDKCQFTLNARSGVQICRCRCQWAYYNNALVQSTGLRLSLLPQLIFNGFRWELKPLVFLPLFHFFCVSPSSYIYIYIYFETHKKCIDCDVVCCLDWRISTLGDAVIYTIKLAIKWTFVLYVFTCTRVLTYITTNIYIYKCVSNFSFSFL